MLSVIPTPLGNLGDVTERILRTLSEVDAIAAEDTRHTGLLLHSLKIRKPLISLHEHNEAKRSGELVERMLAGEHIALVSDAGMPLVSDPGYRFLRLCIESRVPISVLPGPSAITTALAGSGLPPLPFYFGGFLPVKSGRRLTELSAALDRGVTSIYFESPYRLTKSLHALASLSPSSSVCVARELTKKFEEFRRGTASQILAHFERTTPKGEITLLIHPTQNLFCEQESSDFQEVLSVCSEADFADTDHDASRGLLLDHLTFLQKLLQTSLPAEWEKLPLPRLEEYTVSLQEKAVASFSCDLKNE